MAFTLSKVNLDRDLMDQCRQLIDEVLNPVHKELEKYSTVSIERAILRLLGIEGLYQERPILDLLFERLQPGLQRGAAYWLCRGLVNHPHFSPQQLVEQVVKGEIDLMNQPEVAFDKIQKRGKELVYFAEKQLQEHANRRFKSRKDLTQVPSPQKFLTVEAENISQALFQMEFAFEQGVHWLELQTSNSHALKPFSLEDTVTGANPSHPLYSDNKLRMLFEKVTELQSRQKSYFNVGIHPVGSSLPETTVLAALKGVDFVRIELLEPVLFQNFNSLRYLLDQSFARWVAKKTNLQVVSGCSDKNLRSSFNFSQQVLLLLLQEAWTKKVDLHSSQLWIPYYPSSKDDSEEHFWFELAKIELTKEYFPHYALLFEVPDQEAYYPYFYFLGALSGQDRWAGSWGHSLNPSVLKFFHSLDSSLVPLNYFQKEIYYQTNGKVARHARQFVEQIHQLLKKLHHIGFFRSLEQGFLTRVSRFKNQGQGVEGLIEKSVDYFNPFWTHDVHARSRVTSEESALLQEELEKEENLSEVSSPVVDELEMPGFVAEETVSLAPMKEEDQKNEESQSVAEIEGSIIEKPLVEEKTEVVPPKENLFQTIDRQSEAYKKSESDHRRHGDKRPYNKNRRNRYRPRRPEGRDHRKQSQSNENQPQTENGAQTPHPTPKNES